MSFPAMKSLLFDIMEGEAVESYFIGDAQGSAVIICGGSRAMVLSLLTSERHLEK